MGSIQYSVFRVRYWVIGAWCLAAGVGSVSAGDKLDEFKLITDRNIFDSTRAPKKTKERRPPSAPKPKEPPKEYVKLAGVVVLNGKAQALVQGTKFSGMFAVGQEQAGLKIAELTTEAAVVVAGDKRLTWSVGTSLQRAGAGAWKPGTSAPSSYVAATIPTSPGKTHKKPAAGESKVAPQPKTSASRAEILKRLMERRRKEQQR